MTAPETLRQVGPSLWVGSTKGITEFLENHPDGAVISLSPPEDRVQAKLRQLPENRWMWQSVPDAKALPLSLFTSCYQFVTQNPGRPVLIHCLMGLSRSASVAYTILRVRENLSGEQALQAVRVPLYGARFPFPVTLASAQSWVSQQAPALLQKEREDADPWLAFREHMQRIDDRDLSDPAQRWGSDEGDATEVPENRGAYKMALTIAFEAGMRWQAAQAKRERR